MELTHLFYRNLDIVYFIYGFIFIIMGMLILVQPKKMSEFEISNILWLLGVFGISHGINELLEMWAIIKGRNLAFDIVRWLMLLISYIALFEFSRRLFRLKIPESSRLRKKIASPFKWWTVVVIVSLIVIATSLSSDIWRAGSILTRYLLCLPAGILICIGFISYYNVEKKRLESLRVKKYFQLAGASFLIYGFLGGIVVPRADFFPANFINTDAFLMTLKFPVQAFRALCAIIATWALVGMMKIFNWEIKNKLQEANTILREKLKEFEAKYMEIVESSSDIIHSVDKDNMIVSSNKPGCELLGYSQEELIGNTVRELFVSDTWKEFEGLFSKIKKEGSAFIDYGKLKKKNGEKLDVAIHAIAMYDNKRKFLGTRLTCRDITEQKLAEEAVRESEERYRLLFQESRDAIYITTRDGKFFDINNSGLNLFGYTKEEITELNPNQIFADPEDRIKYQKSIEDQEFVRDYPVKLRKKSGERMDCLVTSTIRRSNENNIIGYQGIIRDITEQKRMEAELQKIDKLESLGIMAGGIAHDFNNLLTTITNNISLVSITGDNKLLELLKDSKIACNHARNLTHQLLTFSEGGAPIKKVSYIGNLLKDSSSFALRGSNIRFTYAIPPDLWPVEIDEGQITQVMHNLVLNATQAMTEGGTIDIRAENIKEGTKDMLSLEHKKYIKFSIKDRGIGITKEHIKKIFDPYFTTKKDGSGLGLASTYSIIKNHGGDIDVSSEPGSGTVFHVYLQASENKLPVKEKKTANPVRGTGKILLMDDEQSVRKTVQRMLNYLGYEVEISSNGEEAIDLYKNAIKSRHPFDVIIMDLTIRGGMGGKETINKLLKIDSGVKAIVSSGYFNNPIMADYKKHGFCGVIPKPYEMEELNSLLQSIIIDNN